MKRFLFILLVCTFLLGCSTKDKAPNPKENMEKNDYIIIDVRTNEEYNAEHIKKAINIPYNEIDESIDLDQSKTIFVYCKSGARSNKAYQVLKELNYDVIDLGSYDNAKKRLESL